MVSRCVYDVPHVVYTGNSSAGDKFNPIPSGVYERNVCPLVIRGLLLSRELQRKEMPLLRLQNKSHSAPGLCCDHVPNTDIAREYALFLGSNVGSNIFNGWMDGSTNGLKD